MILSDAFSFIRSLFSKGSEDLPYVKSIKFVVIERLIMTFVYILGAAVVAGMAVFLGKAERVSSFV